MAGLTLVTGGAGSGKTARLVEVAAERYEADRFAPVLVLVPTARHADQFRRRLVERSSAVFGLDVVTINQYARRLTSGQMLPVDVAVELLERVTIESAEGDGPASRLRPILHTSGLHSLVRAAVADLIADDVDPAAFEAAARATTNLDLRAVGEVYRAYRSALAPRQQHDPGEAAALATQAVASGDQAAPGLVLMDGVQFLRGGEVSLIASIARVSDVWLALDSDAGERARWTAAALEARVPDLSREHVDSRSDAPIIEAATAADGEAQLREIARSIKGRLDADRTLRPSDFAVVFRQASPHLALARRVFEEYRLPLDPAAGERLAERPLGTWLMRLLRLAEHEWRLLDILDVMSAGFFDRGRYNTSRNALAGLRRTGRSHSLWGGIDTLRRLPDAIESDIERERGGDPERQRASVTAFLTALGDLVGLLDETPRRPAEHAARLDEALFGANALVHSNLEDYPTLGVEVEAVRRELASVRAVDEALAGETQTLAAFVDALEARLQRPSTLIRQPGGVLLAPMHTLHGLRFRYVAVAGLSEGEFPAPRRSDALLSAAARASLAATGLALPPEPRASEDELWQTVSTRATDVTSLWRTRLDAKGRPSAASYFFESAVAEEAVRDIEAAAQPERTASERELAVSLTSGWPAEVRRPETMAAWDAIVRAAAPVEQRRRSWEIAGAHEGRIPGVDMRWLLDPRDGWSASRLESYRTCSFQFFAHYGLQLSELREEQGEADAAVRGTVVHEILEDAVVPLVESGRPLTPETVEDAIVRLRANAPGIWDSAPQRHAFGRAALWRYSGDEAIRQMEEMLDREAQASAGLGLDHVEGGEVQLRETLPGDPPMLLQGSVDRLDRGPDLIQIVDYKSGKFISRKQAADGDKLQLQLYALAARERFGVERVVARYSFLRLKGNQEEWSLDTSEPADEELLAAAGEVARDVRARVDAGQFEVRPTVSTCPTYCSFLHACRVSHYTRWKEWEK